MHNCILAWYNCISKVPTVAYLEVIHMSAKRLPLNTDDLIAAYLSGESENSISLRTGIGRNVIRRRLLGSGIAPRNAGDAMRLRVSHMSADERRNMASAANIARRGSVDPPERLHARAVSRSNQGWQIGQGENKLREWIEARGVATIPQYPIDGYNIDIAILPAVAVELIGSGRNPLERANVRQRIEKITNLGWSVIYVWVLRPSCLIERTADDVIAIAKIANGDPSPVGKYWVIWGGSKIVAAGSGDLH